MAESMYSTNSQIPRIPEPVVLAWTPDYDDGDVAFIAGSPPPPAPPPPSEASAPSTSRTSIATILGHALPAPAPPPPSVASETNGDSHHWTSSISLAHATVGDGSTSRRMSMIEEESVPGSTRQEESPPNYVEAFVPTFPVDYIFAPIDGDSQSMVVAPPLGVVDIRPPYYIRVAHDLFDPSFFVTSIRKGSNDGHLVGDFKMKADCSALEETVYFKQSEDLIFKKLVAGLRKDEFQWKLQHKKSGLLLWKWVKHWICRYVPEQTASKNKQYEILAQFYPPIMRSPSNPRKVARMTMEPAGQKFFDEILLSLLILERKRKKIITRRS